MTHETSVDLGEDLLEKTAIHPEQLSHSLTEASPKDSENIEDLLQSAKILMNEGLLEDAKKLLHKMIILDSSNQAAHQLLDEIGKFELKQLFQSESSKDRSKTNISSSQNPDEVIRKLDEDLHLGIFTPDDWLNDQKDDGRDGAQRSHSYFKSQAELDQFTVNLNKHLVGGSQRDWIDLGIAFLEIDFYQVAEHLFKGACRQVGSEVDVQLAVSAASLLALSLNLLGKPFDAISVLQPLLRDNEIQLSDKVEIYYMLGRSYEAANRFDLALHFYSQVKEIDSCYRDVDDRIHCQSND